MFVSDLFNTTQRKILEYLENLNEGIVVPFIKDPALRRLEAWKMEIKDMHPDVAARLKFVSKENGKHVSAEIPGVDRSYGVFDITTLKGMVFDANDDRNLAEGDVINMPATQPGTRQPVVQVQPASVMPISAFRDPATRKFEKWKQKVRDFHPEYGSKIKFVSKDNGNVVSAEMPGMDRSFGVFDMATERGQILDEKRQSQNQRDGENCWTGYRKVGKKASPTHGAGVRVNDCEKIKEQGMEEAVTLDRSKNPGYPNDPATVKHRIDTAKAVLSDPKSDPDSRRAAAAIIAKSKPGATEGAKVDRMVKHITKSEKRLGKSKDEAENIAWATANKRGMLDNKNKQGVAEGVDDYAHIYSPEAIVLGKRFVDQYNITNNDDIQLAVEIIDINLDYFKQTNQPVDLKKIKSDVAHGLRTVRGRVQGRGQPGPKFHKKFTEQDVAEGGFKNLYAEFSGYGNYMQGRAVNVFNKAGLEIVSKKYSEDDNIQTYVVKGDRWSIEKAGKFLERNPEQFGGYHFVKPGVSENYPKHQDLSGVSTDKLKAYLAKQSKQSVPGEGNQVKRVRAELQRRSQGVAEGSLNEADSHAEVGLTGNQFHSSVRRIMQDLVEEYQDEVQASTSTPSAPDTSKFMAQRGGMIEYATKLNVHGGYYGGNTQYIDFIKIGGSLPTEVKQSLLRDFAADMEDQFDLTIVPGLHVKTTDGYTFFFPTPETGTNWGGFGFTVSKSKTQEGVAEGSETPEKEIERLKLRQNAEHSRASLKRQAATQARIRELEKQIKDKQQGVDEDMTRRGFLRGLGAAALGAAGIGAAGNAQGKVTFDANGKPINPPDWKNFQGTAPAQGAKPQPAASTAAPAAGSEQAAGLFKTQATASRAAAEEAANAAAKIRYTNPKFREEFERIEKAYQQTKSIVLNNKRPYSSNPDLARRQHAESMKILIAADMDFAQKTNALLKDYGALREQGVAEAATPASVSKVLRLIQRHRSGWFDNYGIGEVEDAVVDMAKMGQFQGMSAKDALALVGQELESLYGQQGVAEAQPEPEQQQIDANRRAALQREREPAGSEKIDAMLAQQHAQRQEYEQTGKFWLKTKTTQQHIQGPVIGKAAANKAALELLKQAPELKGNLLITAYGPGEKPDVAESNFEKVAEQTGMTDQPRIRKYSKIRADGSKAVRYEVLDYQGRRVTGQGTEGFDDLKYAKEFFRANYDRLINPMAEDRIVQKNKQKQKLNKVSKDKNMLESKKRYWCSTDKRWKEASETDQGAK